MPIRSGMVRTRSGMAAVSQRGASREAERLLASLSSSRARRRSPAPRPTTVWRCIPTAIERHRGEPRAAARRGAGAAELPERERVLLRKMTAGPDGPQGRGARPRRARPCRRKSTRWCTGSTRSSAPVDLIEPAGSHAVRHAGRDRLTISRSDLDAGRVASARHDRRQSRLMTRRPICSSPSARAEGALPPPSRRYADETAALANWHVPRSTSARELVGPARQRRHGEHRAAADPAALRTAAPTTSCSPG